MHSPERRVAVDAARAAGHLLTRELDGVRRIAYKGSPTNLVTERDAQCEALIVDRLRSAFAGDAILAEETGTTAGRSGRRWIVDPLDGTTSYAHGLPIFAVSIALEDRHGIALGVIHDPNQPETFTAERGQGAYLNGARLAVSGITRLNESLL